LKNKKTNGTNVTGDKVFLRDHKAVMRMTYTSMKHYSNFIRVTAAYFNGGVKDYPLRLPEKLVGADNGKTIGTQEVIQNDKFRILVLYEPYDVIVDGKIKYYSDNAKIEDGNRIQTAKKGLTVIAFKP
jgi:hypothetical protein